MALTTIGEVSQWVGVADWSSCRTLANMCMEFLNGIFSRGYWAYTRAFSDSIFLLFSTLIFLSTKCYSRIDLRFLVSWILFNFNFKTRVESGFFKNPPVERLWTAWSKRLESFVRLMSKNSLSGLPMASLKSQLWPRPALNMHRRPLLKDNNTFQPGLWSFFIGRGRQDLSIDIPHDLLLSHWTIHLTIKVA